MYHFSQIQRFKMSLNVTTANFNSIEYRITISGVIYQRDANI